MDSGQEDALRQVLFAAGFALDTDTEGAVHFSRTRAQTHARIALDRRRNRATLESGPIGKPADRLEWVGPPMPTPDRLRRFLRQYGVD